MIAKAIWKYGSVYRKALLSRHSDMSNGDTCHEEIIRKRKSQ